MTTISLKLPLALLCEVEQEAQARRVGKSAIIRDCIERALRNSRRPKPSATCLDLMGTWVGSFRGPRDLSSNRRHLTEAISKRAHRKPKNSR